MCCLQKIYNEDLSCNTYIGHNHLFVDGDLLSFLVVEDKVVRSVSYVRSHHMVRGSMASALWRHEIVLSCNVV